ncbi:hypothetical protein HMPREF9440_00949, partial [Sutterella parvirubra YIT 11816]
VFGVSLGFSRASGAFSHGSNHFPPHRSPPRKTPAGAVPSRNSPYGRRMPQA